MPARRRPVRRGTTRNTVLVAASAALVLACTTEPYSNKPRASAEGPPAASPAADDPAPSTSATRTPQQIRAQGNHLKDEPSPYLQQHAHNPVDWYPFGEEALALARAENKPIFLSIGYSTCHWCHVMEHESFEDDEVAQYLGEHFVSIKVDREQRPDIDAVYIDAVRAMGGSTGWPLTVFLTPQLEPFFGGTYYPRHAKGGRPGFLDVLTQVREMYAQDGATVAQKGRDVLAVVEREALAAVGAPAANLDGVVGRALRRLAPGRDVQRGGFGRRQKFPQSPLLLAHLRHIQRTPDDSAQAHVVRTLEAMHYGGIYDPLAGSFHRYAVDTRWHLPHFEKTLYDNAQLASIYIEAGLALSRPDFVAVGRGVLDDLIAHWQRPDGGFIVGFDADDPEGEGHFYSWTPQELRDALPAADAAIVQHAYAVTERGDHEIDGRSVLDRRDDDETAALAKVSTAKVSEAIARSLPVLAKARQRRPPPGSDEKELVAWNGLAISALADAARLLDEPRYAQAAERAAAWVLERATTEGRLLRGVCEGVPLGEGYLDDHALAGLGFVRLHAATGDLRWLDAARTMADTVAEHFYDADNHAFLHVRDDAAASQPGAPLRLADFSDNALPSGGASAVQLLLEVGAIAGDEDLYDLGYQVLLRAASTSVRRAYSSGTLLAAIDHAHAAVREVVIVGDVGDESAEALWAEATSRRRDVLPVRVPGGGLPAAMADRFAALGLKKMRGGKATAYVCERGRCEAPTTELAVLRQQLDAVDR